MNPYDGLYANAHQLERYRNRGLGQPSPARVVIAKRELASVTHVPGDLSAAEIDRRFYAALKMIRWRRCVERTP